MRRIELSEAMETGRKEIDDQHRDLLRKVDDLLAACRARRGEEEMARLLWFLKRYVRRHFRDEEALQLESGFPFYPLHKAQHAWFYQEVRRLELRYAKGGVDSVFIVQATQTMCRWLREHFQKSDRLLVEHLKKRDRSAKGD